MRNGRALTSLRPRTPWGWEVGLLLLTLHLLLELAHLPLEVRALLAPEGTCQGARTSPTRTTEFAVAMALQASFRGM